MFFSHPFIAPLFHSEDPRRRNGQIQTAEGETRVGARICIEKVTEREEQSPRKCPRMMSAVYVCKFHASNTLRADTFL
jgi:hypothetical protein